MNVFDRPGFVPDALPDDSERSYMGIQNVRERIERVPGGKLITDSETGRGTAATILILQEDGGQ